MPVPGREGVSQTEFSRWVVEENAYRGRVAQQLETQYSHITSELSEIKALVRETNGRVGKAEASVAVIQRELEAIKDEDRSIEETVDDIKAHGCNQLANHQDVLTTLGWTPQKKAVVSAGLIGTGALIWPALQEIAKLVHAVLDRTP